jgi:peptidoglycan/LPS O-acetylase OafA/YrhL
VKVVQGGKKTEGTALGYRPQLDGLRCFAILGVLVEHAWMPRPLPWIFGAVSWGGLGVRLFFVLSGFLITGILLDCRERADVGPVGRMFFVRQFYVRRFLRIFPLYYGVLLVLVAVNFERTRELAAWLFTYTSNIVFAQQGWHGHLGHFWTLAVEEQFYLVWPWLLLFLPRRCLVPLLGLVIALAPLYRLYALHRYGLEPGYPRGALTPAVLDSLGAGALVAIVARSASGGKFRFWLSRVALPISLGAYATVLALQHYGVSAGAPFVLADTASAVAFGWLVWGAARGFPAPVGRLLQLRPVRYVGKISYGVYIFHFLVIGEAINLAARAGVDYRPRGIVNFVAVSAVTIAIAAASWHFFERPINGLKRRFAYRDRRSEWQPADAVASSTVGP